MLIVFSLFSAVVCALLVSVAARNNLSLTPRKIIVFMLISGITDLLAYFTMPVWLSVWAIILMQTLICQRLFNTKYKTAFGIATLTQFLHRVFIILYMAGIYAFAPKYFIPSIEGWYSLMYSMLFINITAVTIIWLYIKYQNIKNISENSINMIRELDILELSPKLFAVTYISVSVIDTVFCFFVPRNALQTGNYGLFAGAMFVVGMYAMLMILNMSMLHGLIRSELKLTTQKNEVETLKNYTETIESLLDDMQKSRHDYKNMILSIQDFVVEKRFDELEEYFKKEILRSENIERASKNIYMATKQIKNLPLKSLINAKLNEAISSGIKVEITIFAQIDIKSVPILNLCRIVGNLLDNALDAALLSKDRIISLIMLKNDDKYSITLCNSFDGEIDISKIWNKGYTSKGKNHGQGLAIVKKLVEQGQTNILLNTEVKENLFIQDITITERE